jgi:hypothetical protein
MCCAINWQIGCGLLTAVFNEKMHHYVIYAYYYSKLAKAIVGSTMISDVQELARYRPVVH